MDSIIESILEILKFILWYILWCILLFNLGRIFLLICSLGKYPRGIKVEKDSNFISGVGIGVLFAMWSSIAINNNWNNIAGVIS